MFVLITASTKALLVLRKEGHTSEICIKYLANINTMHHKNDQILTDGSLV